MQTEERKCRVCGCTHNNACHGGCYWVDVDLCSNCAVCEYCGFNEADLYKCEICGKITCEHCGESLNDGNTFHCNECLSKQTKYYCDDCKISKDRCPMEREYQYCYDCPEFEQATQIDKLMLRAHQNAVDKGWWDDPKTFGELISLIHSELSEALEEFRNNREINETYYSGKIEIQNRSATTVECVGTSVIKNGNIPMPGRSEVIHCGKPEGVPSELADAVIRIFDMCAAYEIDLVEAIEEKMKYNETRSHKHGGKKL